MTLSPIKRAALAHQWMSAVPLLAALLVLSATGLGTRSSEVQAQSGAEVRLEPETITLRVEDGPVQLSVLADGVQHHFVDRDVSSDGLGVFQLELHFDPRVVTVSAMEQGPFLANTGRSTSCFSQISPDDEGTFEFACVSESPPGNGPQGSGTLARLTVRPVGGGTSDLTLDGELGGPSGSNGDDIPFAVRGSSVTVIGPPAPTAVPGTVRTPTPRPGPQNGGAGLDGSSATGGSNVTGGTKRNADGSVAGLSVAGGGAELPGASIGWVALAGGLAVAGVGLLLVGRRI